MASPNLLEVLVSIKSPRDLRNSKSFNFCCWDKTHETGGEKVRLRVRGCVYVCVYLCLYACNLLYIENECSSVVFCTIGSVPPLARCLPSSSRFWPFCCTWLLRPSVVGCSNLPSYLHGLARCCCVNYRSREHKSREHKSKSSKREIEAEKSWVLWCIEREILKKTDATAK